MSPSFPTPGACIPRAVFVPEGFVRANGRAVPSGSLKVSEQIRSLTQSVADLLPGDGRTGSLKRCYSPALGCRSIIPTRGVVSRFVNFLGAIKALRSLSFRAFVKHSPKSRGVRAVLFSPSILSCVAFIHAEQLSMENEEWRTQSKGI